MNTPPAGGPMLQGAHDFGPAPRSGEGDEVSLTRMGTIDEEGGFRVLIHTAEPGEPPHVHVRKDRVEVKIGLEPVKELRNRRMPLHDVREALRLVRRKQAAYLDRWREIHG